MTQPAYPLRRTHPLYMLGSLKRFAFLLIIPFLQGLLFGTGSLFDRLYRSGWNAVLVVLIVVMAVLEWRGFRFGLAENVLTVEKGVALRRTVRINTKRIDFLSFEHTPLLSLCGAARLRLETPGGSRKKPDITLLVRAGGAREMMEMLSPPGKRGQVFVTRFRQMALLAASWSNAASGLLLAAPFVGQLGKIFGEDLSRRIYDAATVGELLLRFGVPPLVASVSWLLFAGWAVAFLSRLFKHARFSAYQSEGFLVTRSGLLSRRHHFARRSAVNGVTIQQSLPMVLLKVQTVYLQVVGYGKGKGERALLAAGKNDDMRAAVQTLTGFDLSGRARIAPKRSAKVGYVLMPCILLAGVTVLCGGALCLWPQLWEYLLLLWGFLAVFAVWRLFICLMGFSRAGVRVSDGAIELSTYKNLSLVRGILPRDRVQEIRITQSRIQRRLGICSLSLGLFSEGKKTIVVQGVGYEEVLRALSFEQKKS